MAQLRVLNLSQAGYATLSSGRCTWTEVHKACLYFLSFIYLLLSVLWLLRVVASFAAERELQ